MDQQSFLLWLLVVVVLAVAAFSADSIVQFGDLRGGRSGPRADPPNPDAEFGVIRESSRRERRRPTAPPPPPREPEARPEDEKISTEELLSRNIRISRGGARSRKPDEEYVEISYSSRAPKNAPDVVNVSNWVIGNDRGDSFRLGQATALPGLSPTGNQDQLLLKKGGRVFVVTGRGPLGYNFRTNKCIGYFTQFHSFTPRIPSDCPAPSRERGQEALSDRCFTFIKRLPSCRMPTSLPLDINNQCREYINSTLSYNGCLNNHRLDADFFKNDWWVYLGRPDELWSDIRETITLRNEKGIKIATLAY